MGPSGISGDVVTLHERLADSACRLGSFLTIKIQGDFTIPLFSNSGAHSRRSQEHIRKKLSMATDPKSAATQDSPEIGARITTLDPGAGYVTVINTYVVASDRAEELLDLLVRATAETLRYVPGFVSANFHMNFDRSQVVNYAQWRSREALAAARDFPGVAARIGEAAKVAASFTPIQYELRHSVSAPGE